MYFDDLHAALIMDGHGIYVWPAYVVSAVVIALLLIAPLRRRKRTLAQLALELKRNRDPRAGRSPDRLAGEP